MTAKEVYKDIEKFKLFEFDTPNPAHIVNTQIRRHCKGIPDKKSYARTKYFEIVGKNRYYFLEAPEKVDKKDRLSLREYWIPEINSSKPISLQEIIIANQDFQRNALAYWFLSEFKPFEYKSREEYEDALENLYSPQDVLSDEFSDFIGSDFLYQVANEIEAKYNTDGWLKRPRDEDIDEYYIDTDFYNNFRLSTKNIKRLSMQASLYPSDLQQALYRMLYSNIITAMESYLSDAFINTVLSHDKYVRKFVETDPDLKDEMMKLGDIFKHLEGLSTKVKKHLTGKVVYHRLEKVEKMYRSTLKIAFPSSLDDIFRAVFKRHSLIHRNGKTEDGDELIISETDVQNLLKKVDSFVKEIDKQLRDKC